MEHGPLILGEMREFKRASLERFDKLEKGMESLQRAEAVRRGKAVAYSAMGGVFGAAMTWLVTYLAR